MKSQVAAAFEDKSPADHRKYAQSRGAQAQRSPKPRVPHFPRFPNFCKAINKPRGSHVFIKRAGRLNRRTPCGPRGFSERGQFPARALQAGEPVHVQVQHTHLSLRRRRVSNSFSNGRKTGSTPSQTQFKMSSDRLKTTQTDSNQLDPARLKTAQRRTLFRNT